MEEENKKVIAVVVTYNRKELLKECINALLEQEYDNCDILIVDNASTDGTKEFIKDEIQNKRVHYVNTGANLGGAGGFNYGMKEAYKIGCDFMWLMDDDCIVHKDSLTELMNANKELKGNYGFLSSKVLWKDDSICKMNIQKREFSKWLKDFETNKQTIAMASFVSLFVKNSIVEEVGLPIKDFFIWTDDWEYTRRISRKYKCYYISKSVVTHKSKQNEGASIAAVDDRLERFNYLYRNDVVLYRREGVKGWILLYLRLMLHKLRILKSNKKDKKQRVKIINDAIKEGKKFNPQIEYVEKKNSPIRVLQIYGEPLSNGGQEAFTMNMYKAIDKNKVQFDFFTPFYCDNENMKNEIINLGGKVFTCNKKFETKLRKKYFKEELEKFLNTHKYDIVHINSGSTYQLATGAKIAKKNEVKKVIVHSHNKSSLNSLKDKIKNRILKLITCNKFIKNVDIYLACSNSAAGTKFPKKIIKEKKYKIIKNGIDIKKYKFNNTIREQYREELNLNNKFVICHIGRFGLEKNQRFIVEIFKDIQKKHKNSILLFIGKGEEKEKIEKLVESYNMKDNVLFLGIRHDVDKILQAADLFVFPSLYEGLGIVAIEAQASGLRTIVSENIPEEANISNLFEKINLNNKEEWINRIEKYIDKNENNRIDMSNIIKEKGYCASDSAKKLEVFYLNL